MRQLIIFISLLLLPLATYAQLPSKVDVQLDNNTKQAIQSNSNRGADMVKGYRICIYSDNTQNARANAQKELKKFRELMVGSEATMEYDNPFFRVYTGYCLNRGEAARLLGRLKQNFPMAIISHFNFDLDKLLIVEDEVEFAELDKDEEAAVDVE